MCFFFFIDTATPEIYTYGHTLSLHGARPIYGFDGWPSPNALRSTPICTRRLVSSTKVSGQTRAMSSSLATSSPAAETRATRMSKARLPRSEEHTSELQSLMRISYAVFCLKKKKKRTNREETVLSQITE